MASEIEIICLDDSEDDEFSINQQVQSPDDWCPKIESIYSEAKSDHQPTLDNSHSLFYPSSSSSVEVIHREDKVLQFNQENVSTICDVDTIPDNELFNDFNPDSACGDEIIHTKSNIFQSISEEPLFNPSSSCGDEMIHQNSNIFQSILDNPLFNSSSSCGREIIHQESKLHQSIPQEDKLLHSIPQEGRLLQPIPQESKLLQSIPQESKLLHSIPQESKLLQSMNTEIHSCVKSIFPEEDLDQSMEPSITFKKHSLVQFSQDSVENDIEKYIEDKMDESCLECEKDDLDKYIANTEDNVDDQPDAEVENLDQSSPDKPSANCNIETGYTSMSDNDCSTDNLEKVIFSGESGSPSESTRSGLKFIPTRKNKREKSSRSQNVQDLRSVFVNQDVKTRGASNYDSDGILREDSEPIGIASGYPNDNREMPPFAKTSFQKNQGSKKESKESSGREDIISKYDIVNKLKRKLKECAAEIKILEEAEIDLNDEKNSTYVLLGESRKKYFVILEKLNKAKKIKINLHCKSERKFHFSGSRYPSINKKVEELVNANGFPDYKDILKLMIEINNNEKLFSPGRQLDDEAEKIFKLVGEKLQSRRLKNEEQAMSSYLVHSDGDPANQDVQLELKLQKNLREARRYNVGGLDAFEDEFVAEESESEYSSDSEESDSAEDMTEEECDFEYNMSDKEEDEDFDSVGEISDKDENKDNEEYDSLVYMSDREENQEDDSDALRKVKEIKMNPKKDKWVDEEALTPIDELFSDEETDFLDDQNSRFKGAISMDEDDTDGVSKKNKRSMGNNDNDGVYKLAKSEELDSDKDDIIVLD